MKYISLSLEVLVFGSFIWSALFYFKGDKSQNAFIKFIKYGGSLFILLHLIILEKRTSFYMSLWYIGNSILILSLILFWWSLFLSWNDRLNFAFVPSTNNRLLEKGTYKYIRHPIYTSYLLAWLGGSIVSHKPILMISFFAMGYCYLKASEFEEEEFLNSSFNQQYVEYKKTSGRFFPKLF
jgi:protein-S-isoprenylcysteine O-methyltransferase Ste14